MRLIPSWSRQSSLAFLLLLRFTWSSWVDPDTPTKFLTETAKNKEDHRQYELVFSDEFNRDGRTFHDGSDPRWTAINKNDYTNEALHFYSHDNAVTSNGRLDIVTNLKKNVYKAFNEETKKFYADTKHVQSGMVQGWNKFCFTGGLVEFSAKLPGHGLAGGLWPALWLLGNLARATYVGSSNYMWPYSFNKCDEAGRVSQEINACSKVSHYGMEAGVGRGSPEIDILEAMQGDGRGLPATSIRCPYVSMSLQVSPGHTANRPIMGNLPNPEHWYTDLHYGNQTELNPFFYGVKLEHDLPSQTYQSDALSANQGLTESNYQDLHTYRLEWDPPEEDGSGGHLHWYIDGNFAFGFSGDVLNITGTEIPSEPMYLIMNTAVAPSWGFPPCPDGCGCKCLECGNPDCACALPEGYCDNYPAHFEIDYVRVWQAKNDSKHIMGCSPPDKPTALFIKGHAKRYMEEGDRVPLQPIRHGGGSCHTNADCGNHTNGTCSDKGRCLCPHNFTGPNCLAHAGFYDHPWELETVDYTPSVVFFPPGLIFGVCLLILGFALVLTGIIRKERREVSFQKLLLASSPSQRLSNNYGTMGAAAVTAQNTYQQQPSDFYALPGSTSEKKDSQKVVTYCVIDGRLVDQ